MGSGLWRITCKVYTTIAWSKKKEENKAYSKVMHTGNIKLILHAEFQACCVYKKMLFQFLYVKDQ